MFSWFTRDSSVLPTNSDIYFVNSDMRASRVDSGVSLVKVGDESLFKV